MKINKFDEYIGEKIYQKRVLKHITQDEMAKLITAKYKKKCGKSCSRPALGFYELGQRSMPKDLFVIICGLLDLDWKEVFNEALDYCKVK